MRNAIDRFMIENQVCVITGGAGLMADSHARAVLSGKGIPVLLDIDEGKLFEAKERLSNAFPDGKIEIYVADITNRATLQGICDDIIGKFGHIDILINNAANNPKMESFSSNMGAIRFDNFPVEVWNQDIAVGLTGALLCSQVFGSAMEKQHKGVILNISSDLGVIAPDQRIYRKDGVPDEKQTVKPVTYSVVKHGLI